jgi:nucleotide-binding universal stress UspA family protein
VESLSRAILVPTDFGPGSRLALDRALRSLGAEGGTIDVLHVLDEHLLAQLQALLPETPAETLRARLRQQAETQYAQLVAGLEIGSATLEPLIVEGRPFLKILQLARDLDVDMIGMTVHRGDTDVERLLFGSTAERVLRLAPCPVLMVPESRAAPPGTPVGEASGLG